MSARTLEVSKRFGPTQALDKVSVDLKNGSLHALLGANGSGKSTLARVLAGAHRPDSGTIQIGDTSSSGLASPREAMVRGVRVVHQESPFINSLSVSEAFAMARGYGRGRALAPIPWRRIRAATVETLDRFSVPVRPDTLAADLTPSLRAMVSLALALDGIGDEAQLLILDEVTASIPEAQAGEFLERVHKLPRDLDIAILMVTHRFKEVAEFADEATVLAHGSTVWSGSADSISAERLVGFMTAVPGAVEGKPHTPAAPRSRAARPDASSDPVLQVEDLAGGSLEGVTFDVHPGEIIGFAGLPESGIADLPSALVGVVDKLRGRIGVGGDELPLGGTPADAMARGIALIPADRLREGGIGSLSVAENMTLPQARQFWHRRGSERAAVARMSEVFDIRPRDPKALFGGLSGGNQQKVIIAKWLLTDPKVLVLDDPTVGVDPGARQQLFSALVDRAERGLAVVVFSSEPEQLATYCSRVLVLGRGRIVAELRGAQLSPSTISADVITLSSQA